MQQPMSLLCRAAEAMNPFTTAPNFPPTPIEEVLVNFKKKTILIFCSLLYSLYSKDYTKKLLPEKKFIKKNISPTKKKSFGVLLITTN